jgi:hypothetical protein
MCVCNVYAPDNVNFSLFQKYLQNTTTYYVYVTLTKCSVPSRKICVTNESFKHRKTKQGIKQAVTL